MDRPLLFGKYCLLERTSVGGMAEVFRAKPLDAPDPDRYFALKRILPHLAEDEEFIKMFADEARLTVQLRHPNIVHIFELGQFQSSHYIVMEFIAGKDLLAFQKLVRRQDTILDVDMSCHILLEIAKGLDYAHRKTDEQGNPLGIIHRDISPQNVLVSWDGRVRVIDFGIAKAASQSTKTKAGVLKGKFGYLSPEQVRAKDIDRRSDIFAMGILFWELLTNQRLFNASNQYETLTLIGEPDVDRPSSINPEIPPRVDDIAMRALRADPEDRYQWASEFAQDLEKYLMSQKPPYHRSQLTTWLRSAFEEEFEEEKQKRESFRQINSADDVRKLSADEGGEDGDEGTEDATQIWDVDEAPDSDVDLESFVANHTVVQAGGLELSDYDDWEDAPDTIDEAREVVQSRIDEVTTGQSLERVKIAEESQYEAPPTVITDPPSAMAPEQPPPPPERPQARGPQSPSTGGDPTLTAQTSKRAAINRDETGPTDLSGEERATATAVPTPPDGVSPGRMPANKANVQTGSQPIKEAGSRWSSVGLKQMIALTAIAIAVVAVASLVVFTLVGDDEVEEVPAEVGGVLVDVVPATDLEIYVDGDWRGERAPLTLRELEPGGYRVEIDHPDYPVWDTEIEVQPAEVSTLEADLRAQGRLVVRWDDEPEDMELFIDGQAVDIDDDASQMEGDFARGEVVVDAYAKGVRPIRLAAKVEADSVREIELDWIAIDQLTLTGNEALEVEFDGRTVGNLPLTLSGLTPDQLYELRVGEFETVLGYPEVGHQSIDADEFDDLEVRRESDFGWVTLDLDSEQEWELVIDDVATGLMVPRESIGAIPVAAGSRTIGFQRLGQRHDYRVVVEEGEDTYLRLRLPAS